MTKTLEKVETPDQLPDSTRVVIIGGGIVGVTAALALAERNIPVVLLEKGHIAGEQSSRNLGWIRKTNRHLHDVPLAQAADKLWAEMPSRVGRDVGYKQAGIMFLAKTEPQLEMHKSWLKSVESLSLDSRMVTPQEIDELAPGGKGNWLGGIYTPSDGNAEPSIAASAIANAAIEKGAVIVQQCAVRTLSTEGGKISGVVTEKGEIRCEQVLLAGGAWSRRFLGNLGISFPTLPLICSVLRTKPMEGPTNIAIGGPDFSFRKHQDGGYIITQRGKLDAPITLDHMLIGHKYLDQLRTQRSFLNVSMGSYFFKDLGLSRRWNGKSCTPFEKIRTNDPQFNADLNQQALNNLRQAWPIFEKAEIAEAWAGIIDVTPDSNPVIDHVKSIPGLTVATGFSGHGFGTGPAAGQLAADLISNMEPIIDPTPYRFERL
ncbi:MAG: FAD-binding oxidoreductase [Gammaproteobacteria bacterium]|jgi:glycine/D-amino acid oxidase-like deaminating enzyme|uniref:NAD(P)/FAD-dependent oxidoreductase n=1 Tax=unclassified Marinomonas TaxID=196814 RepID=UPI000C1E9EC1|nr:MULTISPECIES: FAD-binding oxidoreductase [unclassified Marinomonas]MBU1296673.1 FAD-binding oxidoreductase [Gammaproteobacteria bacterium]MBU1466489.1 FAD-binding oxidoreductase [Gammaproteobacteria bacterium]MBU2023163.1 FAD-binding oxidoreductase [Gammaproteobacteria bacterium]MBU2238303.1 FAD-binding oxidoreductase [Gammaproteobacteria bacterium]MBU2317370.1 FAD-binding oxidoreductase [Gammaproteobacteria bacterium]